MNNKKPSVCHKCNYFILSVLIFLIFAAMASAWKYSPPDKKVEWVGAVATAIASLAAVVSGFIALKIAADSRQDAERRRLEEEVNRKIVAHAIACRIWPLCRAMELSIYKSKRLAEENYERSGIQIRKLDRMKIKINGAYEKIIHSAHYFDAEDAALFSMFSGEMHEFNHYVEGLVLPSDWRLYYKDELDDTVPTPVLGLADLPGRLYVLLSLAKQTNKRLQQIVESGSKR